MIEIPSYQKNIGGPWSNWISLSLSYKFEEK